MRSIAVYLFASVFLLGLFTAQISIATETPWKEATGEALIIWGPWTLIAPLVLWLAHRFPIEPRVWLRHLILHAALSFAVMLLAQLTLENLIRPAIPESMKPQEAEERDRPRGGPRGIGGPPGDPLGLGPGGRPPFTPPDQRPRPQGRGFEGGPRLSRRTPLDLVNQASRHFPIWMPIYWGLVVVGAAQRSQRRLRLQERDSLELESRLARAQLDALKLQLRPHFLFNALNAIATLVHRDPDKADEMIGALSVLLRRVIELDRTEIASLAEELDLLRAYIQIEQIRFEDRLHYIEDVEPIASSAPIPLMLLQPIAENAVRHGIEPLDRPGTLTLRGWVERGRLIVEVEDDGVGRGAAGKAGTGTGLRNAQARLDTIYGPGNTQLSIQDNTPQGVRVTLNIPCAVDQGTQ